MATGVLKEKGKLKLAGFTEWMCFGEFCQSLECIARLKFTSEKLQAACGKVLSAQFGAGLLYELGCLFVVGQSRSIIAFREFKFGEFISRDPSQWAGVGGSELFAVIQSCGSGVPQLLMGFTNSKEGRANFGLGWKLFNET